MTEPSFTSKSKAYISFSVMIFAKRYRDAWTVKPYLDTWGAITDV